MATTNVNYTLPNSSSPLSIGYYSDSPTDVNGPTRNLIGACAPNFPIKKEDSPQISHFPMQLTQCRSPEDIHLDHKYGMGIRTPPDSPKHKPTTLQIADSPGFSPPSSTMGNLCDIFVILLSGSRTTFYVHFVARRFFKNYNFTITLVS